MNGYMGKVLMVDLSQKTITTKEIPQNWYEDFLGGEGLGVRLFYDHMDPNRAALDPRDTSHFRHGTLERDIGPRRRQAGIGFSIAGDRDPGTHQCGRAFRPGA